MAEWSIATAVGIGVARVVSDRLGGERLELATGQPGPGMAADEQVHEPSHHPSGRPRSRA